MAQQPFLKSIRPLNLLSFGPNTKEIELRPLNILIGPNGSGKSNLIEVLRLLCMLPEKEPWAGILDTGGVDEWMWKGKTGSNPHSTIHASISLSSIPDSRVAETVPNFDFDYSIRLDKIQASFRVGKEIIRTAKRADDSESDYSWFESNGLQGEVHRRNSLPGDVPIYLGLSADRSVLSQLAQLPMQLASSGLFLPELYEIEKFFDSFDFHQDWEFGADLTPRDPRPVGQPVERLEENAYNLAQMLAHFKDNYRPVFDRVNELMKQFYEPLKSVDVRLYGTHLQVVIHEEGGYSIPAYRLSDGTLRWLALLAILLNPTPAPVTCIDEPELGLHPDIIPTLADLLRDASTRTQLILTTHSTALVDAFSDEPEAVCVCEKVNGATEIQRLEADRLKVWLEKYSLGHLWASGEIGGNRW
jgi:predicted ATPase